jgi:hypothetical protein
VSEPCRTHCCRICSRRSGKTQTRGDGSEPSLDPLTGRRSILRVPRLIRPRCTVLERDTHCGFASHQPAPRIQLAEGLPRRWREMHLFGRECPNVDFGRRPLEVKPYRRRRRERTGAVRRSRGRHASEVRVSMPTRERLTARGRSSRLILGPGAAAGRHALSIVTTAQGGRIPNQD